MLTPSVIGPQPETTAMKRYLARAVHERSLQVARAVESLQAVQSTPPAVLVGPGMSDADRSLMARMSTGMTAQATQDASLQLLADITAAAFGAELAALRAERDDGEIAPPYVLFARAKLKAEIEGIMKLDDRIAALQTIGMRLAGMSLLQARACTTAYSTQILYSARRAQSRFGQEEDDGSGY
jgi:hypothetical protein